MIPYKTMYCILCKSISDALDQLPALPETAATHWILQKGLLDAEEAYIAADDESAKEQ